MSTQPPPSPSTVPPFGAQPQGSPPPPPQGWPPQGTPPVPGTPTVETTGGNKPPAATIFQVAAAILTIVALALSSDGQDNWYSSTVAWAIFATIAAIVQLAPSVAKTTGWSAEKSWTIGAAGVGGLFAWWVLIALPAVSSNQGFAATMAIAAALIGAWLAPGRRL